MQFGRGFRMVFGMQMMAVGGMAMMSRGLDVPGPMIVGRLAVMLRGLVMMVRGGFVMFGDLRRVSHGSSPGWLMDGMSGPHVSDPNDRTAVEAMKLG
jgi:hypothetical protein